MNDKSKVTVKRFENPDETRRFEKGQFQVITMAGMTLGRAQYQPGWRWSEDVRPIVGTNSCQVEHLCMVVSGRAAIAMDGGDTYEVGPGDIFFVPPGHDSWVVGDEPYVSLHFVGTEGYAQ